MDLRSCTVTLTPEDRTCEVADRTTLLEALARLDLQVTAPCGGEGTCGKCRVQVTGSVDPPGPDERGLLTAEQLAAGMRLACHARVRGPVQVSVPASSRTSAIRILPAGVSRAITPEPAVAKQVVHFRPQTLSEPHARLEHLRRCGDLRADLRADLELLRQLPRLLDGSEKTVTAVSRDDYLIAVEEGDTSARCFGLALDLGTTTVVASLVDLATGREAGHAATLNRQTAYGHDVIARINMTIEEEQGLEKLRQAALESLEEATAQVLERQGVRRDEVYEATLVGNTTMMHLCLGISPASLGHLPYVGLVGDPVEMPVRDLGLSLHPRARLYVLPNIAGFVGADTVGAILASGLDEDDGRIRMMADIGTNCEIALRHGERLFVTSTPAGPAFEGARITCGMYAVPGAIEEIHLDEDVRYKVIGGGEPRGLCGSALIDVGAELLRVGLVDFTGRMVDPEELDPGVSAALRRRLVVHGGEPAVLLAEPASGSPVVLTQRDLRELQLAKGSIRTAIDLLIEGAGLTVDAVDEFCLAGGFGNYIDKANAMRLGLIPAMPLDKLRFIGNGALVGARLALLSRRLRQRGTQVARQSEHLQVAKTADFQARFAEAMLFT